MGDINSSEISATLESSDYFFMSVDGKLRRVKVDNEVLRKIIAAGTTETLLCTGAETTLTLGKDYNVGDTLKFECLTTDTDLAEITYEISAESSSESGDDDELIDIGGTGIVTITPTLGTNTTDYTKVVVDSTMTSFTVNEYVTVYRIDGNIIVDSELSEESINPIQNKVVAKKIAEITVDVSVLSEKIYQNGMAINELSEGVDELSEGVGELSEKVNNYTETLLCTGAKTTLTLGEDYNVGDTLKFECLSADADFVEIFCATSTEGNFESITIDPTSDETAYVTVIVEDDMLSFTVNKVVTVYRIYSKVLIDSELSEESTNPVQNKVVAKKITEITNEISQLSQEKVDKNWGALNVGKILVVGTDGNLVLIDMPEGGSSGDVTGVLDESNNILLSGNLADGTYTLKYLNEDGTYTEVGTLEVGGVVVPAYTNILTSGTYAVEMNKRWSGSAKSYTACDGMICLIVPAEDIRNKTIRFKGFTKDLLASNQKPLWMYLDANKTKLNILTDTTGTGNIWSAGKLVDEGNGVYSVLCGSSAWNGTFDEAVYVSINMAVNESLAVTSLDGLVMTIDEEIV